MPISKRIILYGSKPLNLQIQKVRLVFHETAYLPTVYFFIYLFHYIRIIGRIITVIIRIITVPIINVPIPRGGGGGQKAS